MGARRLAAIGLVVAGSAAASEWGSRPVTSWTSTDHGGGPQSWAVAQDTSRRIHVGNLAGHLVFDAERWSVLPVTDQSAVAAVAALPDGRVLSAGFDMLGTVGPAADGGLGYSWQPVAADTTELGEVRALVVVEGEAWIQGSEALFRLAGPVAEQRLERVVDLPADRLDAGVFAAGGQLLVWTSSEGLRRRSTAQGPFHLEGLATPQQLGGRRPVAIAGGESPGATASWVLVFEDEVGELHGNGELRKLAGISAWLRGRRPSALVRLPDGRLALGVRRGGIAFFDAAGQLDEVIDGATGLLDDTVLGLFVDADGALWAATDAAISRIDVRSPLSVHDRRHGLLGAPRVVLRSDGVLHVGTAQGLFRLAVGTDGRPRYSLLASSPTWSLAKSSEDLLVGTDERVLAVPPQGAAVPIPMPAGAVYALQPSTAIPGLVWVGARDGLGRLERAGSSWRWAGWVEGAPALVRSIVETPEAVWLGTVFSGIARVTLVPPPGAAAAEVRFFGEGEVDLEVTPFGMLAVGEQFGVARVDPLAQTIEPLSDLMVALGAEARPFAVAAGQDSIWLNTVPPTRVRRARVGWEVVAEGSLGLGSAAVQGIVEEPDGVVWMLADHGLVRWHAAGSSWATPRVQPVVTGVRGDDRPLAKESLGALAFGIPRRLRVELSALRFEPEVWYRSRLTPLEEDWSLWTREAFRELTTLREGEYALRVQSRVTGEPPSPELVVELGVLPPWYRRALVQLGGLLVLAALVLALVRWRLAALRARTLELEREVESRTADLSRTVEELRLATLEVGSKNLALEEANAALRRLSERDGLTGIANRRAFDATLAREWAIAGRSGASVALVLADLDWFKDLNDARGHLEGDECLRAVALVFEAALPREGDLVARFGGEELAVILPATELEGAVQVAERLAARLADLRLAHPSAPSGWVTASFGVAAEIPSRDRHPADLVANADAALYRAKREGRARICTAG